MTKRKFAPESEGRQPAATVVMTSAGPRRYDHHEGSARHPLAATEDMVAAHQRRLEEEERRTDEERQRVADERRENQRQAKFAEQERIRNARGIPRKRREVTVRQLGQSTWERGAKSGFQEENLAPPGAPAVYRAREKAPLTHPDTEKRMTYLDKAMPDSEVHGLYRFIVGTMVGEARMRLRPEDHTKPVFSRQDGSDSIHRLPFNEHERIEIGARQFVYSRLPEESQRDMEILTDQVMPRLGKRESQFYISPIEFGKIVSGSTDERVGKGAYIGTFRKLAHHVNQLYVEWEVKRFKQLRELKAVCNGEDARLTELSTGNEKKLLANHSVIG